MSKRMEIGDEIYVWDTLDKLNEFKDRVKNAREEVKEKGFILFYMDSWYQNLRSPKAKMFYKNTITKFKPMEMGGAPIYKPHYVYFVPFKNNDGKLLSRCRTSNAEEIAFLDMKKGVVREDSRELSPYEKQIVETQKLKLEVEELKKTMGDKKDKPKKEPLEIKFDPIAEAKESIKKEKEKKKKT